MTDLMNLENNLLIVLVNA